MKRLKKVVTELTLSNEETAIAMMFHLLSQLGYSYSVEKTLRMLCAYHGFEMVRKGQ